MSRRKHVAGSGKSPFSKMEKIVRDARKTSDPVKFVYAALQDLENYKHILNFADDHPDAPIIRLARLVEDFPEHKKALLAPPLGDFELWKKIIRTPYGAEVFGRCFSYPEAEYLLFLMRRLAVSGEYKRIDMSASDLVSLGYDFKGWEKYLISPLFNSVESYQFVVKSQSELEELMNAFPDQAKDLEDAKTFFDKNESNQLGEWRPHNHPEFPRRARAAVRVLGVLAKARMIPEEPPKSERCNFI